MPTRITAVQLGEDDSGREILAEQDRLFELRIAGDGEQDRSPAVPVVNDLQQVGEDLSPEAEADLIARGWK
jgi:hypothetical protein